MEGTSVVIHVRHPRKKALGLFRAARLPQDDEYMFGDEKRRPAVCTRTLRKEAQEPRNVLTAIAALTQQLRTSRKAY
jgi:hypothetical protein